ncbi:hypothetical protein D1872_260940 [compost metagenome]
MRIRNVSGSEIFDFSHSKLLIAVEGKIRLIDHLFFQDLYHAFFKKRFRILRKQKFPFDFKSHASLLLILVLGFCTQFITEQRRSTTSGMLKNEQRGAKVMAMRW